MYAPSLRSALMMAIAFVAASSHAQDWGNIAVISDTMGNNAGRLCIGEGLRVSDIGCPSYAPSVSTAGHVSITGNVSANQFIGDGSLLTGISNASGDRIVSGTSPFTQMIAISDTRIISITQGGSNTGWFDPTRGLVTLGVSATGPISGTNGYFSGKVGVGTGTVAPLWPIHISGTFPIVMLDHAATGASNAAFHFAENGASRWAISNLNGAYTSVPSLQNALTFYQASDKSGNTLNSYRMVITDDGNVGIGTVSPTATLQVSGTFTVSTSAQTTTPSLYVGLDAKVGVGTSSPAVPLHILGSGYPLLRLERSGSHPALELSNGTSTTGIYFRSTGGSRFGINVPVAGDAFVIETPSGNVGISNTTPRAKLDVVGTISATDAIQVGTSGLACSAGIPGAIRYNGGNMQYCNGTSWTTLGTSAGVTGTGSATAVAFWSGPSAVTYSDGFYWDNSNKRLGVATNTPSTTIQVSGTALFGSPGAMVGIASGLPSNERGVSLYYDTNKDAALLQAVHQSVAYKPILINYAGGRTGVGMSTSPTATLQISGSFIVSSTQVDSSPSLYVGVDGNVGVGTMASNGARLTINGRGRASQLHITSDSTNGGLYLTSAGSTNGFLSTGALYNGSDWLARGTTASIFGGNTGEINFYAQNGLTVGNTFTPIERMRINSNGNVGISNTNPIAKLDVNGTISASSAIQIGTASGLTCSSGISGSIRYSQVSSTMEYCNSTAWVSMGSSATDAIGFRAQNASTQTVAAGTYEKMLLGNENFDTNSNFASGRFTATVPGTYYFSAIVACKTTTGGCNGQLYVNGSAVLTGSFSSSANDNNSMVSGLLRLNSGDYVELWGRNAGATTMSTGTYLQGFLVGPQVGGAGSGATALSGLSDVNTSGASTGSILSYNGSSWVVSSSVAAGVSAMASLTDVTLTNLAGRDYLRYDSVSSKWVNISESNVMNTTTIEPGWPDAIRCSGASGSMRLRNVVSDQSNGKVFYRYGDAATHQVVFNPDGSADTTAGTYVADCASKSISQLYAEGKAFNFIGNANTSGGALGDRLTSGTVPYAVTVNSATGIISLSSGGTDWGYLSSAASYLPIVSASKVSSTNVSATHLQLNSPTTVLACNAGLTGAMRYTSGTMQVCDGMEWGNIGLGVPTGTIAAFATASCPSGWNEYMPARGRFLRGIDPTGTNDSVRAAGNVQADALQNIEGYFRTINRRVFSAASGAFFTGGNDVTNLPSGSDNGTSPQEVHFDASRVARTSDETRPKNVAVRFCMYAGFESAVATGITTLGGLSDVAVGGATPGQVLAFDGASWVASNTSVGSSGVSAIASLTDVQLTNLAGRDYLRYDSVSSKWVNISESAVMSTTTMISNWPDAIRCNYSASDDMIFYYYYGATGPTVIYMSVYGGANALIRFNTSDKSYLSNNGLYNGGTYNCISRSISQLYASGQAFNFIGNANTSGGALGDRITSGTLPYAMALNSATGIVSLSSGATTWGYLGSVASYLPNFRSTNISASSAIQVGSNSLTCTSGISGSIRYSHVSSTMEYCQGTAWVSMGPSATTVPAFSAFRTANQTVSANTWVKIQLSSKNFDTQNNFDSGTNYRFQPLVAGKYIIAGQVSCASATGYCSAGIFRNGSLYLQGASYSTASGASAPVVAIIDMNGSTDYVELYAFSAATTLTGGSSQLQFSGSLIASGNGLLGGGGGGGATALSGLTDVQLTHLSGRDYLRYDNATSKWVNVSESTVMSTTTMVTSFPDAIACVSGGTKILLYADTMPFSGDGFYYYRPAYSSASNDQYIRFTPAGAYSNHTSLSGFACLSKSISQLYTEGNAFNFIGSANVSGGIALGDRITSGTLAMVANSATSIVSLSTNGTVWGYLGGAASYLPTLRTSTISASAAIQVGSNSLTCSSGISGSIRYSQISSTMEYCNSTAWVSMGPSDTTPISFMVDKNGSDQTVTSGVNTKLTWSTERFDTNNNFASDRFTPTRPGKYLMYAQLACVNNNSSGCIISLVKNGSTALGHGYDRATSGIAQVMALVDLNGSGDYVETFATNHGGTSIAGYTVYTYFTGTLIASGNGMGGGGSADNLGNHTATQNLAMGVYNIVGTGQVSVTDISVTHLQLLSPTAAVGCGADAEGALRRNGSSGLLEICQ